MIKLFKLTDYFSDRRVAIDFVSYSQRQTWLNNYTVFTFNDHQYVKNLGHQALTITIDIPTYGVDYTGINYLQVYNAADLDAKEKVYYYYVDRVEWKGDAQATLFCSYDAFMNLYSVYDITTKKRRVTSTDWTVVTKRHFDRFTEEKEVVHQRIPQSQKFDQIQLSRTDLLDDSEISYLALHTLSENTPISVWDVYTREASSHSIMQSTLDVVNIMPMLSNESRFDLIYSPAGTTVTYHLKNSIGNVVDSYTYIVPTGYYAVTHEELRGVPLSLNVILSRVPLAGGSSTDIKVFSNPDKNVISATYNGPFLTSYVSSTSSWPAWASIDTGEWNNGYGSVSSPAFSISDLAKETYSAVRVLPFTPDTTLYIKPYLFDATQRDIYIKSGSILHKEVTDTVATPTFDTSGTAKPRVLYNDPMFYSSQFHSTVYSFEDQTLEYKYELENEGATHNATIHLAFSANGYSSVRMSMVAPYYVPVNENDDKKVFAINNNVSSFTNAMNDWTNNFKDIDDSLFKQRANQAGWGTAISAGMQIAGIVALGAATGGASAVATGAKVTAGVVGIGGAAFNAVNAIEQNKLSYERQKTQMLNSIINISGAPVDVTAAYGDYTLKKYVFGLKPQDAALLDDLLFYEGYECAERTPLENLLLSRTYFNYIKADADFIVPLDYNGEDNYEIMAENIDSLKSRIANGLTVFHCKLSGGSPRTDITDWDQSQENWETYI